ncbi:MAG: hypothetical protein ACI4RD_10760 [Kiritimatiellia bacterium]
MLRRSWWLSVPAMLCAGSCFPSVGAGLQAATVRSDFVGLTPRGKAYAPVWTDADASVLADLDESCAAAAVADFAFDGSRRHPAWQTAKPVGAFGCRDAQGRRADFPVASDIRLLYSPTALYVGGSVRQPMDKMFAQFDQHDLDIYADDNVELFLYLRTDGEPHLYQWVINPLGSVLDVKDANKAYWTEGGEFKAVRGKDGWTFEMRLPYAALGVERPFPDDVWAVRLCRTVHVPQAVGQWPYLASGGHGQKKNFARLCFAPPPGTAGDEVRRESGRMRAETARRRFYRRYRAAKRRFEEIAAGASLLSLEVPCYAEAREGVEQMRSALREFETRHRAALAAGQAVPPDAAAAFFAEYAGFERFASDHAYVIWRADPWANGTPDAVPTAGERLDSLAFAQAVNEREVACLYVAGVLCGPRYELRFSPQTVRDGERHLVFDRFEVYREPYVRVENAELTAPLLPLDGNLVTVTPGSAQRVWITLNSRGVRPGEYATAIRLKSATERRIADRVLPVAATIWDFELPEARDWPLKSFFWGPHIEHYDETQTLKLMHDYHVGYAWTKGMLYQYGLTDLDWYAPPRRKFEEDFDPELCRHANEEFFRTARQLDMRVVFGWGTPKSPRWFRMMSDRLLGMGFKYEDFIFKSLISDEFQAKDIPVEAQAREAVWQSCTNYWFQNVYLSTPPPQGATMEQIEAARLPEFYRQWMVIDGLVRDPQLGPDVIRRLRAKGCEVWSYRCELYMQTRDLLDYYRLWLWNCYLLGLDGAAMWCATGRQGVDGFDSRDGYDDGILWEGFQRRQVPTKRFEAFREGLEDVAYMALLERVAADGGRRGTSVAAEARRLLDGRAEVVRRSSMAAVLAWRRAAGELLHRTGAGRGR